ncbi:2'-5' RNA ligase superfamily protein [Flavobacterium aquidurense]|uniref:Mutarotase n=1 Tax=Flavobacterium frigidimaris TaxID=262320 RepID=A0ABX4BSU3_FLAFR|nr:2'-5' RNA ligase family protein [Flavobacterium frigidimaris]OXA80435.1 mutarotase [Flavobacterium frigidimaris]SDY77279.1 2'-5' RNA ligase superfamily protein [Flavobacterium aquidurense]
MNLQEHYSQLYTKSSKAILEGNSKVDNQINDASDSRFGITLLIRPNDEVKAKIQLFLNELRAIDSKQYYYPNSDIHITVMSIISCYEGFTLAKIKTEEYIEIIQKSLLDVDKIKIELKGITASPSAIMIQGFPTDESMNNLRNTLRENFKKSTLQQSIDSRYAIATAHSTVVRFQEKLENPEKLIAVTEKFRDCNFGEFTVTKLELVYNDWYQRESKTISLADFYL